VSLRMEGVCGSLYVFEIEIERGILFRITIWVSVPCGRESVLYIDACVYLQMC